MTNKEKFLTLVSETETETMAEVRFRNANRSWLRESGFIAWKVLDRLDELQWSENDLAEKMEISKEEVTSIVRGNSDLKLSTIVQIEAILGTIVLENNNL